MAKDVTKQGVGFIGLGAMGKPMAANLIAAGYDLSVTFHRNRKPAEELEAKGAKILDSARKIAEACGIVVTMLPADREVLEVFGELLPALSAGALCIEMTSATPNCIREVAGKAAEKGIAIVDAPVSGGTSKAVDGSLTIMAGGEASAVERARPLLEVMGGKIYETGEAGSGKAFKMINQLLNAGNTLIASEALYLARKLELDLEKLVTVVGESSGGSWIFANKVPKFMAPRKFDPGFKLELMNKDVGLSTEYAREQGVAVPLANLISQIYRAMLNRGNGDRDYTVVSRWIEEQNGGGDAK